MKYVIKKLPEYLNSFEEFYTGNSYIVQGERYLVFDRYISKAKTYSTKKRAENAINSIYKWNISYKLFVEEIKE